MRPVWRLLKLVGQLDALRFAAGKRRRGLSELDVAQSDIDQRLQLLLDLRNVFQHRQRFLNRQFPADRQWSGPCISPPAFRVVAAAAADVAGDINIRQKIHFDAALAVALAGFAAPAFHVEAEASRFVAALARFRQHGVEVADRREHAGVGGGIRARRAPDGRLIDVDDFIDVLRAGNGLVRAGLFPRAVKLFGQRAIKNVVHQRGFAGAGNAGDHRQQAQRKFDVDVLQIVFAARPGRDAFAVRARGARAHGNLLSPERYWPVSESGTVA